MTPTSQTPTKAPGEQQKSKDYQPWVLSAVCLVSLLIGAYIKM